jgi:uncharacterized protein YaaQ
MKLIVAIVQDYDTDRVLRSVTAAGFRVTRISSVGGFLRSTNATLFMGVEDDQVSECLFTIRSACATRIHQIAATDHASWLEFGEGEISPDAFGGAVILVIPVDRFARI